MGSHGIICVNPMILENIIINAKFVASMKYISFDMFECGSFV